jgi:hypothetical protein
MGACGTSSWAEAWRGGGPGRRRRWAPQPPRVLTSEVAEAVEEMVSTDAMGAGSSSPRARTAMDRSPETVSSPRSGPATNHLQGASHRRPSPTSRTRPTAPWPPPMLRVRPRRRPPPGRLAVPGQPSPVKIDLVASAADQAPRRQDGHISPAAASWFSAAARGSTSSGWTRFPPPGLFVLCRRPGSHVRGMDAFPCRPVSLFSVAAQVLHLAGRRRASPGRLCSNGSVFFDFGSMY